MRKTLTILWLRLRRTAWVMLLVSVISTAGAAGIYQMGWFGIADQETGAYDSGLAAWTQPRERSRDILIVAIDDRSIEELAANPSYAREFGGLPYRRGLWAKVFPWLSERGARAIVFDGTFVASSTDPSDDYNLVQSVTQNRVPLYVGAQWSAKADPLPAVEAENAVRLPLAPLAPVRPAGAAPPEDDGFTEDAPAAPVTDAERQSRAARALAFPVEARGIELPANPSDPVFDSTGQQTGSQPNHLVPPIEGLWSVVPGLGLVSTESDDDGKMRRTRFAYSDGRNTYVTLAVAVAADLLGADRLVLSPGRLELGSRMVPINLDGSAWLDFGGELQQRFDTVSLSDVVDDLVLASEKKPTRLPPELFRDKVVFVAGFALGTKDEKATPFSRSSPGVMKHVTELTNLLEGRFIVDAPFWVSLLITFLVALLSVAILFVVRSPFLELGWPIALFFLFYLVPGWFLVHFKVHVLSAVPSLAGSIASVAATVFNHFIARRDREELRQTFSHYMEKDLLDLMVEGKNLPSLEGEHLEITAFFSDIRGFTTFSEHFRSDPRALMRLLNRYLTTVTQALVKEGACIDKYIGDCVVALFGAPVPHADHAVRACRAAVAVRDAVGALREQLCAEGLPDVYTRIGLNTDRMLVGNLGSEQLVDYTAIGDGMNLASRLEGVNKHYQTLILIGPKTYEQAREAIVARELDTVRVAGKRDSVVVYELVGMADRTSPALHPVLAPYSRALAHYRASRFADALTALAEARRVAPDDGPTAALTARCEELLGSPPREFDGVTELEK